MSEFQKIFITAAVTFCSTVSITLFAEPIRRWLFSSVITLEFKPTVGFGRKCVSLTNTNQPGVMAKYIRVLATCSSRIRVTACGCRPFLTKIEKLDTVQGGFKELHHDPIPLKWAYVGDKPLDIHPAMAFYFDVVEVNSLQNSLRPQTVVVPQTWSELLREPGRYRFSVVLSGENIKPVQSTSVEFDWNGSFDLLTENCFSECQLQSV